MRVRLPVIRNAQGDVALGFRRTRIRRVTVTFRVVDAPEARRLRARVAVILERRVGGRVVARLETRTRRVRVSTGRWRWIVPVRVSAAYPLGSYRMRVRVALHPPSARWKPLTSASRIQTVRLRPRG